MTMDEEPDEKAGVVQTVQNVPTEKEELSVDLNGEVEVKSNEREETCKACSALEKQVSALREELHVLQKKFERAEKQLEKAEFERDNSTKYVESFREQVSQLHEKLAAENKKSEDLEKLVREKEQDTKEDKGDWSTAQGQENADTGMDIASSIREAAKEIASSMRQEIASSIKEASKDIASSIREAAQQATTSHGFVFDETTGLYYDYKTGYYYDPNTRLYYDYRTGIYYTYDQEKGTYEFYSQVAVSSTTSNKDGATTSQEASGTTSHATSSKLDTKDPVSAGDVSEKREIKKIDLVESGSEDGEIVEVDEVDECKETQGDDDGVKEKEFPPCIRAIVLQSEKLPVGSLNIITCMGLTFGRTEEGGNNLRMSDIEVSKEHAKVYYDDESNEYYVKDLGSQNGTFINGSRLSESKQESEAHKLSHGEQLKIGSTTFLLHIHPGGETCDECEPGQVQAQLKANEPEDEVQITRVVNATCDNDPNAVRKKELKRLKKRYMLQNSEHEVNSEIVSNNAGKYKDRAQTRRKKVGSEAPNADVTESPASVFKPIKSENKGRMMLEKMGWVDGEGLGKSRTGITEPVMATIRETGRGLGYGGVKSIDMPHKNAKSSMWKKTQERYKTAGRGNTMTSSQTSVSLNWVKKPSKPETVDIFADDT